MPDEIKPGEGQPAQPAGSADQSAPTPNPGPSAEELLKQKQELENQLKERDAKIADLETTRATIEARQRQVEETKLKQSTDAELKERIKQINDRRAYDPDGADAEMAQLLAEREKRIAEEAVTKATGAITQQTFIEKLKSQVKSSNPEFDDDVVDVVMSRADALARTGKYKTADDAVKAATEFVKSKFESYAQKKNAVPPLPSGALAEGGGANFPPKPPEPPKEKSPLEEMEEANEAKRRRLL